MFDRYIALGMNCEVVVQLRRLTGCRQAHVFDWQLTVHDGLLHVLRTGFADYFRLENLVLPEHRKHVLDTATGMEFHHLFPHNIDGTILPERMVRAYPQVRARADHLMRRWHETVNSDLAVLYVRRDAENVLTEASLVELRDVLRECYPAHRFALLWARDVWARDVWARDVWARDGPRTRASRWSSSPRGCTSPGLRSRNLASCGGRATTPSGTASFRGCSSCARSVRAPTTARPATHPDYAH